MKTSHWRHAPDEQPDPGPASTVSLQRWLAERGRFVDGRGPRGVRVQPGQDLAGLGADLPRLQLVVIELAHFADGRAFSIVRLLRERYGYAGEIRITGDYLADQIDAFLRAGADSFELPERIDPEDALAAARLSEVFYQPGSPNAHRVALGRDGLVIH